MIIQKSYLLIVSLLLGISSTIVATFMPEIINVIIILPVFVMVPGILLWLRFFHLDSIQRIDRVAYSILFSCGLGLLVIISEGLY